MAVIRLEFDIDSDVHPELHAMLSTIASLAARGERLRQLAATGLVWERTRIESLPPPTSLSAMLVSRPVAMKAPAPSVPAMQSAKAAAKKRPPGAGRAGFVDLAIDAAPGSPAPPIDPLALREFEDEVERAVRELPELFDVLDPADYPPALVRAEPRPLRLPAEAPAVPVLADVSPASEPPPQAEALAPPAEAPAAEPVVAEAFEGPMPEAETPPAPAKRSRLMRMKDKGLFKNE